MNKVSKKKSNKTNTPPSALGSFELDNGVVVVRPPVDTSTDTSPAAKSDKTVVNTKKGTVMVEVQDATPQVWDQESEVTAHQETVTARQENMARAKEAHVATTAKKLKTGSIVSSGTISDIDISEYDSEETARSRASTKNEN